LLVFFWEIGGQNIPNDWTDVEQDRRLGAKTVPIAFGLEKSGRMILVSMGAAVFLTLLLFAASPADFIFPMYLLIAAMGGILLIWPAVRLRKNRQDKDAMHLFNAASYYPLALLAVAAMNLII